MNNVLQMVNTYKCTGCSRCIPFCPYGYISIKQGDLGFPVPYIEECNNCGICMKSCPFSDEFEEDEDS